MKGARQRSIQNLLRVHVITNAPNVASELVKASGVSIIMTGGALRKRDMSLIGPLSEQVLRQVPFEAAFMSVQGGEDTRQDTGILADK